MQPPDAFQVVNAPQIQGLVFRKFRGITDIGQMWLVRKQVANWDKVDPQSSRESLPAEKEFVTEWSSVSVGTSKCIIVEVDEKIIGYSQLMSWTEQDAKQVYLHLGWLLAEWRKQGIGSTMINLCQARVRELVARQDVTGKVELATNVSSTEKDAALLMQNKGYQVVHTLSDMVLPELDTLRVVKLPVGIEIRPVLSAHYRNIYGVYSDAYSKFDMTRKFDEQGYQNFVSAHLNGDASLYKVGWSGDIAVGIVLCDIRNGVGTIEEVEVRRAFQRRGIARALLTMALMTLAERGIRSARLYTAANDREGARTLYESLGFQEVKQHYFYRKTLD
jgi:ribosomal protein S18 acetylase RimI-like enzyme